MRLLALLLLFGCKSTTASSASLTSHEDETKLAHQTERIESHTAQGPETITTTVEEWVVPVVDSTQAQPTATASRSVNTPHGSCCDVAPVVADTGRIIRRTITVDQRGPVTQDTTLRERASAQEHDQTTVEAKTATASHREPSSGCALGLGFWGGIGICVLLALGILYLKFKPTIP